MKTIHKYPIEIANCRIVVMRENAAVIRADFDPQGVLCLWAYVNTDKPMREYTIHIIGTGHEVPPDSDYLGTVKDGLFMWHIFIEVEEGALR